MKKTFLYFILPALIILICFSIYTISFIHKNNGVIIPPETMRFLTLVFIAYIICLVQVLYYTWKNAYKTAMHLDQINNVAKKFKDGSFAQRFSYSDDQPDEITFLNKSLNNLVAKIEKRIVSMQQNIFEKDAVLLSMSEAVVAVDLAENIYLMNKSAKKLFGIESEKYQPQTLAEVIRDPDLYKTLISFINNKNILDSEFVVDGTMIGHNERNVHIHIKSSPILDRKQRINGVVFVFKNTTQLKKLEKHRSNFVGNVSHELKTPLTLIHGFSETLMEDDSLNSEDRKKYIGVIHKHSSRLGSLIDDLLSISKLEHQGSNSINFETGELSLIVKSAINLCKEKANTKDININFEDLSNGFQLEMNFSLMEQAILNLIDNAIKHSPQGSKVEASLYKIANGNIQLDIKDYGSGIEQRHLPHLFERFYRVDKGRSREFGGTGLGLSIVKHVIQLHGGHILVASEVNNGSCFSMTFPNHQ